MKDSSAERDARISIFHAGARNLAKIARAVSVAAFTLSIIVDMRHVGHMYRIGIDGASRGVVL
jgi:hypothetical protein